MVWYISAFNFETTPKKLGELEKIILHDGKTRFVSILEDGFVQSAIRFIEGKNSSFLRQSEDYFLVLNYYGIFIDEGSVDDAIDYDFGIQVGSTDPDTKKIVTEKVKNYLIKENINFEEIKY